VEKMMKKKTMILVLIAVAITVVLVCIVGIIMKPAEPPQPPQPSQRLPPITQPAKFETVEIKIGESALVKGNLIKLISIEEENNTVKIEVFNETTGEPMIVPLGLRSGTGFKYKNIVIIPLSGTLEDGRISFACYFNSSH
jgi:hypothetical protein